MVIWPSWLWIGTRFKALLWLINRLATWTGSFYVWRRFRSRRSFWFWLILIQVVSLTALVLLFFWLYRRTIHG